MFTCFATQTQDSWISYQDYCFDNSKNIYLMDIFTKQPQLLKNLQYKETETEFLLKFEPFGFLIDGNTFKKSFLPNPYSAFFILHLSKQNDIESYLEYFYNKDSAGEKTKVQVKYNYYNFDKYRPELLLISFNESNKELLLDLNNQKKHLLVINPELMNTYQEKLITSLSNLQYLENLTFCGCTNVDSCIRFFFKTQTLQENKDIDKFGQISYLQLGVDKFEYKILREINKCYFYGAKGIKLDTKIVKIFLIIDNKEVFLMDQSFYIPDKNILFLELFSNNKKFDILIDKNKIKKTICHSDGKEYEVSMSSTDNAIHIKLFTNQESKIQKSDYENILDYRQGKKDSLIYYDDGKKFVQLHEVDWVEKYFSSILGWSILAWAIELIIIIVFTNKNVSKISFIVLSLCSYLFLFFGINILTSIYFNFAIFLIILIVDILYAIISQKKQI